MKKSLLLKLWLLLCVALLGGTSSAWGAEMKAYTFATAKNTSNTAYANNYDVTIDGLQWSVPGNQSFDGYVRIGGKSLTSVDRTIKGKSAVNADITRIAFNHNGISDGNLVVNSVTLTVATDADFTSIVETKQLTPTFSVKTTGSFDYTPSAGKQWNNCYYKFSINVTNSKTSNYGLDVTSIVFYKTLTTPSISFTEESVDVPVGNTYTQAASTVNTGDATVSYTSSKPEIATVDATGKVTGIAKGTATITAKVTVSGTDYTANYTVNVFEAVVYKKVTTKRQLLVGNEFLIAANNTVVMGAPFSNGTYRVPVDKTIVGDSIVINPDADEVAVLTLGGSSNAWTFKASDNDKYLALNSASNALHSGDDATSDGAKWVITSDFGLNNVAYTNRTLKYNSINPRFACYTSGQKGAYLYVKKGSAEADKLFATATISSTKLAVPGTGISVANITTDPEGLEVTYSSSNSAIVSVAADGTMTAVADGTATVTAKWAEQTIDGEPYAAGQQDFTVVVYPVEDGIFDFTTTALNYGSNYTAGSVAVQEGTWTAGKVTMKTAGRNCWYNGQDLRLYATSGTADAGSITFSVPDGYLISKIEGLKNTLTPSDESTAAATWKGTPCQTITFTYGDNEGNAALTKVTVTYIPIISTIAAAKELKEEAGLQLVLTDAKVLANGNNHLIVEDATGTIELYKSNVAAAVGKKIDGKAVGAFAHYNGVPEIKNATYEVTASDLDAAPVPTTVAIDKAKNAANILKLVKLVDVNVVKKGSDYYAAFDEDTIKIYDYFKAGYKFDENIPVYASITGIIVPQQKNNTGAITWQIAPRSQADLNEEMSYADAMEKIEAMKEEAVYLDGTMSQEAQDALDKAVEAYVTEGDTVAARELYKELKAALEAAKASIEAYEHADSVLAVMQGIAESNNFMVDGDYAETYAEQQEAYDNKTLNDQTAATLSAQEEKLLSAWTADTLLHVNKEGAVPFVEISGDATKSLPQQAFQATLSGKEMGEYTVNAVVTLVPAAAAARGAAAAEEAPVVTMQVCEGEPVAVVSGTPVAAKGVVRKDSKLTLTLNVAKAESGISAIQLKSLLIDENVGDPDIMDLMAITPADSAVVDSLKQFALTFAGKQIDVNIGAVPTLGEQTGALSLSAAADTVYITFAEAQKEAGQYELNIPANAVYYKGVALEPMTFTYTIEEQPEPGEQLVELPEGVESEDYTLDATQAVYTGTGWQRTTRKETVQVAFDGSDVYVQGLGYYFNEAWVKGELSSDGIVTFKKGQLLGEDQDGKAYFIGAVDTEDSTYVSDVTMDFDAETRIFSMPDSIIVGEADNPDSLYLYSYFYYATLTPGAYVEPTVVELPEGLTPEIYDFTAHDKYSDSTVEGDVMVAFKNDSVYIQGLSYYLPEAWVVGTLKDGVLTIPETFLGAYNYIWSFNIFLNPATFSYDAAQHKFTSLEGYTSYDPSEGDFYFDEYDSVTISKANIVAATPAAPVIKVFENSNYGYRLRLTIPLEDVDGNKIYTPYLAYQVYSDVDGTVAPFVFKSDDYIAQEEETMTVVPYNYADEIGDIERGGSFVYIYDDNIENWSRIGVKSIYTVAGETRESSVTWWDVRATVGIDAAATAEGQVTYTDLQGRRINAENARGLVIRQVRQADGTVVTTKVIRR